MSETKSELTIDHSLFTQNNFYQLGIRSEEYKNSSKSNAQSVEFSLFLLTANSKKEKCFQYTIANNCELVYTYTLYSVL